MSVSSSITTIRDMVSIRNVTVRCWWPCALIRSLRRCNFVSDSWRAPLQT